MFPQPAEACQGDAERLAEVDEAVRQIAAGSLVGLECKERSLVCLGPAREARVQAELVIGVAHDPLRGHVWVEAHGRVLGDDPEHSRSFDPVRRYK